MGRKRGGGFKINTGKWGKPTSVRVGSKGKGNLNISKKGVKFNPGCCILLLVASSAAAVGVISLAW